MDEESLSSYEPLSIDLSESDVQDISLLVDRLRQEESKGQIRPREQVDGGDGDAANKRARSDNTGSYSKYWCFTSYRTDPPPHEGSSYIVYQREVCPETKREHWQGYVEFSKKKRFNAVKLFLEDNAAHLELRKGTAEQCRTYCTKLDSRKLGEQPHEYGEISKPSANEFETIVNELRTGATPTDLLGDHPSAFIRYYRGILAVYSHFASEQRVSFNKPRVSVIWGPPGTGKTRWVMDYATDKYGGKVYRKSYTEGQPSWWDGYKDHELILIDDFEGREAAIEELLTLLDGYGHTKSWPIKGGFVSIKPKEIIFTSNTDPINWYALKSQTKKDALKRRFDKVVNMALSALYSTNLTLLD